MYFVNLFKQWEKQPETGFGRKEYLVGELKEDTTTTLVNLHCAGHNAAVFKLGYIVVDEIALEDLSKEQYEIVTKLSLLQEI